MSSPAASVALLAVLFLAGVGYQRGLASNAIQDNDDGPRARVSIEVLPGQAAKVIDRSGNPVMPVVIYGSRELDVARIDLSTVTVADAPLFIRNNGKIKNRLADLNHDGFADLVVFAWVDQLKLDNRTAVEISGRTVDGLSINGFQSVQVTDSSAERPRDIVKEAQNAIAQSGITPITPETLYPYTNPAAVRIPATGSGASTGSPGSIYPSTITVSGFPTVTGRVAVVLNNFEHCFPDDVDILLVGPTPAVGTAPKVLLMADCGGSTLIGNRLNCSTPPASSTSPVTFSITSDATRPLIPDTGGIPVGSYQPTKGSSADTDPFPSPAPAGPYPTTTGGVNGFVAGGFIGINPNGNWDLYTVDDGSPDFGDLLNGWTLELGGPTAAPADVSGQVTTPDGQPLGGVIVQLSGASSARTITDAQGNYRFENVDSGNFYTVSPQRANFSFSPAERSFSLSTSKTDAVFTATANSNATSNPLDSDLFFIRQQYLDFLGREPDAGGLAYWASELDKCGSDVPCLNSRRTAIAAAFFKELEYQRTGSFVYRIYKGALGRRVSFDEFSTDRASVIDGPALESSKSAYAEQFVRRADFEQKYSEATSAESFVDALISNIKQTSTADLSNQRSSLIESYRSGADINQSRALALRAAIDSGAFTEAEYNPSFVLMEYFGYLKREPEEGGYQFWLNVLNNREPGNYNGMVCSFITSTEYQSRFAGYIAHSNRECSR